MADDSRAHSLLDRPRMESRENRLAVWGLVLAVAVWPVGLIISTIALMRARKLGGVGTSQSVAGLIIAPVLAAITVGVVLTVTSTDTRNDPACRALRPSLPQISADVVSLGRLGRGLSPDAKGLERAETTARDGRVRDAIAAVSRDIQLIQAGQDDAALTTGPQDAADLNRDCGVTGP